MPLGHPIQRQGQAPVDDQGLAEGAEHDVAGLEVAVQHATRVGVGQSIADVEEPAQQLAELERLLDRVGVGAGGVVEAVDGLGQGVAPDEPHGVERAAGRVVAQAVDRDDPGVLELAGDLGLEDEPGPTAAVVGVAVLDLLEGDLAVKFVVQRHRDDAEPAAGVRPDHPEPAVPGGGHAERGRHAGLERVGRWGDRLAGAEVAEAGLEVGVGDPAEVLGHRADRAEGLQAPGGVAAVGPDVLVDQGFEQGVTRLRQVAPLDEQGPQWGFLADDPGVHRREEGVAGDEVHLLGQDAQQQVAVGVDSGHRRPPEGDPSPREIAMVATYPKSLLRRMRGPVEIRGGEGKPHGGELTSRTTNGVGGRRPDHRAEEGLRSRVAAPRRRPPGLRV